MKTLLAVVLMLASPLAFAATTISVQGLVQLIIVLLVLAAICWLLLFIIAKVAPPEPFNRVLPVIVYVFAALVLIFMLLNFAGYPVVTLR